MRYHRHIIAALAAAGLAAHAPAPADAQQVMVRVATNRGMLGFASEQMVGARGQVQRVVVEIVKDSPAERAGVMVGDTLVRFNGLQPTQQVLGAFQAGDTVTLRLRRNGAERDVRLVAAARPDTFQAQGIYALPDSIRNTIAIMVDRVRADLDTINFPRLRIERLPGDSTVIFFGGERIIGLPEQRMSVTLDSARNLMLSRAGELRIFADSLVRRAWPDSTRVHFRAFGDSSRFRLFGDSGRIQIFSTSPDGRIFEFRSDTVFDMRPGEVMRSGMVMGMRAIAGAELSELNPALGEYFGTLEGVLVLRVPDGTPAARAGLQPGDVILRANDAPVGSIAELRRIVDRAQPGSAVRIQVLRKGTRFDLNMNRL